MSSGASFQVQDSDSAFRLVSSARDPELHLMTTATKAVPSLYSLNLPCFRYVCKQNALLLHTLLVHSTCILLPAHMSTTNLTQVIPINQKEM